MEIEVRRLFPVPREVTVEELQTCDFSGQWITLPAIKRTVYVRYHDAEHLWITSMGSGVYNEVVYKVADLPRYMIVLNGAHFLKHKYRDKLNPHFLDDSNLIDAHQYLPQIEGDSLITYETFFLRSKVLIDLPDVKWVKTILTFSNSGLLEQVDAQKSFTDEELWKTFHKVGTLGSLHKVVDQFFQLRNDGQWHVVDKRQAKRSSILRDAIYAYELAQKFSKQ